MKKIIILLLLLGISFALRNPAAVYCESLGYDYNLSRGDCEFGNNESANAWAFLRGEAAQDYGYCAEEGYQMKIVNNTETCMIFLSETCAVCVLENGSEVEITELMGLDLDETACGDGACSFAENYSSCPEDCEKVEEEPEEIPEEETVEVSEVGEMEFDTLLYVLGGLIAVVIIGIISYYVLSKKRNQRGHL